MPTDTTRVNPDPSLYERIRGHLDNPNSRTLPTQWIPPIWWFDGPPRIEWIDGGAPTVIPLSPRGVALSFRRAVDRSSFGRRRLSYTPKLPRYEHRARLLRRLCLVALLDEYTTPMQRAAPMLGYSTATAGTFAYQRARTELEHGKSSRPWSYSAAQIRAIYDLARSSRCEEVAI